MKRTIIYIVLIAAVFVAPVNRLKISDMEPVEALLLKREGEYLTIMTDTGRAGTGPDISRAIQNLQKNTPSVLFLDTTQYVLVCGKAEKDLEALKPYLKKRVEISYQDGPFPDNWAAYLR